MTNFPLKLTRPLVVFDIESTGISPRKDRIVELCAVRLNLDGSESCETWLLNPTVPIPAETTAIHGISDDDVKNCPTFADRAKEIYAFFENADLSGYNADRFDIPCLEEEFARVGMDFGASRRKHVDVQRIYHRLFPRDLTAAVREYLHRDHAGAHGAEADARATLDVLKAQLVRHADILPDSIDALDTWIAPRDILNADRSGLFRWKNGEWTVNFGKKKGEPLKKLMFKEPNFFAWMVKGDFDTDARMIAQGVLDGRLPPSPKRTDVDLVVFDFGGVLTTCATPDRVKQITDAKGLPWDAVLNAFRTFRRDYDLGNMTIAEFYECAWREAGLTVDAETQGAINEADTASYLYRNERTLAWMRTLRAVGYRLAILTNMPRELAPRFKETFADYIALAETTVISCEEHLVKPMPEIYRLVESRTHVAANRILFIDDSEKNCEGARCVGWQALRFTSNAQIEGAL